MSRRVLLIVAVAASIAALFLLDKEPAEPTSSPQPGEAFEVGRSGSVSSTWYCPIGSIATGGTPEWRLVVENPTKRDREVRITVLPSDAAAGLAVLTRPIAASTTSVWNAADLGITQPSAVIVEADGGGIGVEQRLSGASGADAAPCATRAAAQAFFPALDTQRGNSARLWLANPFAADASIDIEVASAEGVRIPAKLRGLVVPARSTRLVELGEVIQRNGQFAVAVRARAGLVVAGLAQGADGTQAPAGLRLELGRQQPASMVTFAAGGAPEGSTERIVIYNPGRVDGRASLSVVPVDGAPPPEPFLLDLPARRFVTVDLDAETRVDRSTPHWIQVQSLTDDGLVATRLLTLSTNVESLGSKPGRAGSSGLTVGAREWSVPYVAPAADATTALDVLNPGAKAATVIIKVIAGGARSAFPATAPIEVPPGRMVTVDATTAATAGAVALELSADQPVLVERRTAGATRDLSLQPALPHAESIATVPSVFVDGPPGS